MGSLSDKTALITGGGRGFGRAVALLLAREGADLALADLGTNPAPRPGYRPASMDDLQNTRKEVQALGRRCHAIEANVTRAADCERMAREAIAALGHLDILVANAGAATNGPAWMLTEEEWDFVHGVNLKGVFLTTKYVIPHMIERRAGKIVIVASRNGLRAERNYAHYNAAKAGAIHFAKSLALELGPYDVNVNAVCPTQMSDKSRRRERTPESGKYWDQIVGHANATYEEFDLASGRDNLLEMGGQPDFSEVAEGVLWLVSERARLVTGLALPMDAGWIAKRGG
jgi:NAD(P)-dependent dehydrogenase (short-subunit alcohol dehydrogenase family)